jgi:hypothetical protein
LISQVMDAFGMTEEEAIRDLKLGRGLQLSDIMGRLQQPEKQQPAAFRWNRKPETKPKSRAKSAAVA